jgi:hypothetical protein
MTSNTSPIRVACAVIVSSVVLYAAPALAETAPAKIDPADTAWMISATGLVLMMTIPGLALFYCGMVRKKNVLATMAQSLLCTFLCSILWAMVGYSLTFTGAEGSFIGTFERLFLRDIGMETTSPLAKTIPEILFMMYQMTFAIITVALVAGSVADRMRFSAFVWFAALWLIFVYVPIAHWVWGNGWLQTLGLLDFAGGTVVHLNAGVAGLVAASVLGKRHGYGTENFAPHDLSLAVIGTGLLWVGWFGFNGGSALGANSRAAFAIVATHLAASMGALTWMFLEWWTRGRPRHYHAGLRLRAAVARHRHRAARGRNLLLGLHQAQSCTRLRRLARRVRRAWCRRPHRHFAHRRVRGGSGVDVAGDTGWKSRAPRRQSASGADPALRHRRHHRLVRRRDLRPVEGDRIPRALARDAAERDRRSRRDSARRGSPIAGVPGAKYASVRLRQGARPPCSFPRQKTEKYANVIA